jgi:predicted metal-binding membrane protein
VFTATHLRPVGRDRAILTVALAGIAGSAMVALLVWEGSPYGHYLHHDSVGTAPLLGAGLFTVGWLLMIVAMMLPSSVPLVVLFAALVRRRHRAYRLVGLLLVGYLLVWTAFGLAAWIADRGVHAAADALPWLGSHPQLIMGATLLAAGLWQFSPLRDRCLDECRSPLGFVMNRWRGTSERREALLLGMAHGAFCVGCCWSLMLVMFGVGVGSLTLMLALGGVTAIEKNLPSGRRLTHPVGIALVLAAVYAVAS